MKGLVVGIIPDGSRTWCRRRGVDDFTIGYRLGAHVALKIVNQSMRLGVAKRIVIFTLSHQDLQRRSAQHISAVCAGIEEFIRFLPKEVRLNHWGDFHLAAVDERARAIPAVENLVVDLLLGYSADWDLKVRPIQTAVIPELDFVFRTAGNSRLSGFLPWQASYAELYFYKGLWPTAGYRAFLSALKKYRQYQREMARRGGRGA